MADFIQFTVIGVTMGIVYGLVGLGYTIVYNATDTVNFAHGEYVMLGGMLTAWLHHDHGMAIGLAAVVAVLAAAVLGSITKVLCVPRTGTIDPLRVILLTLALAIVIRSVVLIKLGKDPLFIEAFTKGDAYKLFGATVPRQALWILGVAALVVAALAAFYKRTRFGQGMLAASMDDYAARIVGVNVGMMVTWSFALSAAIGAIAGIVVTPITSSIYNIGVVMGIKGFVAAAIGGISSAKGTLLGGVVLGIGESYAAGYISSGYKTALGLALGLAVVLIRPRGLFAGVRR